MSHWGAPKSSESNMHWGSVCQLLLRLGQLNDQLFVPTFPCNWSDAMKSLLVVSPITSLSSLPPFNHWLAPTMHSISRQTPISLSPLSLMSRPTPPAMLYRLMACTGYRGFGVSVIISSIDSLIKARWLRPGEGVSHLLEMLL